MKLISYKSIPVEIIYNKETDTTVIFINYFYGRDSDKRGQPAYGSYAELTMDGKISSDRSACLVIAVVDALKLSSY